MLGNGASSFGGGCELVHGGNILLDHDLAEPCKLSGVARLQLASRRVCSRSQLTSLLVSLLSASLPAER